MFGSQENVMENMNKLRETKVYIENGKIIQEIAIQK